MKKNKDSYKYSDKASQPKETSVVGGVALPTTSAVIAKPSAPRSMPKHEQVRAQLLEEFARGHLQPGDALPTEHQLAELMQVSRSTIRLTLGALEREGLIQRVRGKGTFLTGQMSSRSTAVAEAFAIILPDSRSGFFPSLQRGFGEECRRFHKHMVVYDTDQSIYRQADSILQLIDQRVAGVAIVPPTGEPTPPHHVRPLQTLGVPVVFCHRSVSGIKAPLVGFDGVEVGRLAATAMLDHGHRHIAYFGACHDEMAKHYEAGLREVIEEYGGSLDDRHVCYGQHTHGPVTNEIERATEPMLRRLLEGPDPPTAIFVSFDTTAESIYMQLSRLGLNVPGDISIVSFGGTWREGAIARNLTSVTVDEASLGRIAGRILGEMRMGVRTVDGDEKILLPLSVTEGKTLASPPS